MEFKVGDRVRVLADSCIKGCEADVVETIGEKITITSGVVVGYFNKDDLELIHPSKKTTLEELEQRIEKLEEILGNVAEMPKPSDLFIASEKELEELKELSFESVEQNKKSIMGEQNDYKKSENVSSMSKNEQDIEMLKETLEQSPIIIYKPKSLLSSHEIETLQALKALDYNWIAREEHEDRLMAYIAKPIKRSIWWDNDDKGMCDLNKNLFRFIKWVDDNPYSIEEMLEGDHK